MLGRQVPACSADAIIDGVVAAPLTLLLAPLPQHAARMLDPQYVHASVLRPSPNPTRTLVLLDGPLLQQADKLLACVALLSGDAPAIRTAVLELLDRVIGVARLSSPVKEQVKRVAQLAAPLLVMNTAGTPCLSCTVIPVRVYAVCVAHVNSSNPTPLSSIPFTECSHSATYIPPETFTHLSVEKDKQCWYD